MAGKDGEFLRDVCKRINFPSFLGTFVFSLSLSPQPGLLDKQTRPEDSTSPLVEWEDLPGDVFAAPKPARISFRESNSVQKKSKTTKVRVPVCLGGGGWKKEWGRGGLGVIIPKRNPARAFSLSPRRGNPCASVLGEHPCCWVG